mmetsp:Transcript_30615/g.65109  ORF Transcript_30615/g.65109 Transcript_30615/m.65109 type:complete len:210 (-) Transcript_30615:55-684(-)
MVVHEPHSLCGCHAYMPLLRPLLLEGFLAVLPVPQAPTPRPRRPLRVCAPPAHRGAPRGRACGPGLDVPDLSLRASARSRPPLAALQAHAPLRLHARVVAPKALVPFVSVQFPVAGLRHLYHARGCRLRSSRHGRRERGRGAEAECRIQGPAACRLHWPRAAECGGRRGGALVVKTALDAGKSRLATRGGDRVLLRARPLINAGASFLD